MTMKPLNRFNSICGGKAALLFFLFLSAIGLSPAPGFGAKAVTTKCPEGMGFAQWKITPFAVREFCIDSYEYPNKNGQVPMTGITWHKAKKICASRGKRLCEDGEWKSACLGCPKALGYGYGDSYEATKCNSESKGPLPSGDSPACKTGYGAFDMVGNVAEWTAGGGVGSYGGSFGHGKKADCRFWQARSIKQTYEEVGFRCCKTIIAHRNIQYGEGPCPAMDSDGDGTPDAQDSCPVTPEDMDGFQDADGCPDTDNDQDGIPDSSDRCMGQPEDRDGFADSDGCPDLDNDGDGILDSTDQCSNDREDRDAYRDSDGCPDPDNDRDGIVDSSDRCPDMAGPPSNGGCPEEKLQNLSMEVNKSIVLSGLNFVTNSAEFTEDSYQALALTLQTLVENPEIYVEVRGYTDNIGNDDFNLDLSRRRAEAVRDYLIQKGIAPGRVSAVGFGKKFPMDTNRTAEGRANNRRVELYRAK